MPKGYIQIFYDCLCLAICLGLKSLKEIVNSLVFCSIYFNSSKPTKVKKFYFLCTI